MALGFCLWFVLLYVLEECYCWDSHLVRMSLLAFDTTWNVFGVHVQFFKMFKKHPVTLMTCTNWGAGVDMRISFWGP